LYFPRGERREQAPVLRAVLVTPEASEATMRLKGSKDVSGQFADGKAFASDVDDNAG
jgi:hypothetical protein